METCWWSWEISTQKVGDEKFPGDEVTIGRFRLETLNTGTDDLVHFATVNNLVVCNTLFCPHKRGLCTWSSADRKTRSRVDYILVRRRRKTSDGTCARCLELIVELIISCCAWSFCSKSKSVNRHNRYFAVMWQKYHSLNLWK